MVIIVVSIILLLLAFILFAPIEVRLGFREKLILEIRVLGIKIPFGEKDKKPKAPKEQGTTNEKQAEESLLELLSLKEKIELAKKLISKFLKYSRTRIEIKKINIAISFGMEDAAKTAILAGAFWATLYGILPVVDQIFRVLNHKFEITPLYNQEVFHAEAEGIIRTRTVHIIFIGTVLLIQLMRYKKVKKAVLNNE